MSIITLTSDWGYTDHYIAVVKGLLYSQLPEINIVDISHDIEKFDILKASYVIKNAYHFFPENSIHIIAINTIASIENPHIVVASDGHYFIGADNGIFPLILENKDKDIVELEIIQDSDCYTFSTKDVFVKAAVHIAKGGNYKNLGFSKDKLYSLTPIKPYNNNDYIIGTIIYIDNYGNAITNIPKNLFIKTQKNRNFDIRVRINSINKICQSYQDVKEGNMLAVFGSNDLLQIAINKDSAKNLLSLDIYDEIKVIFY